MDNTVNCREETFFFEKEFSLTCRMGEIVIQKGNSCAHRIWLINGLEILQWQRDAHSFCASDIDAKSLRENLPMKISAIVDCLLHAIPLVKPFPAKHKQLMQLVATTGQRSLDLLQQNPAMAYLIVSRNIMLTSFDENQYHLTQLLCKKRHQILDLLHYPSPKWMVQLLARIQPHECNEKLFNNLARLYETAEKEKRYDSRKKKPATLKLKILRHHMNYPGKLLVTLLNSEQYLHQVSIKFLQEIGAIQHIENEKKIVYELDEIKRITSEELLAVKPTPKIHSLKQLSEIHSNLIKQLSHIDCYSASRQVNFSLPVYQGREICRGKMRFTITALKTGEELYQEGKAMNHCIFSYQSRISSSGGRLYAYHAQLDHEHASVLVAFPVDEPHKIVELRGPANRDISGSMQQMVNEWLQGYSCKLQNI